MATRKKSSGGEGVIPRAGVASPFAFDYGTYTGVDNEMRKKAGYPPLPGKTVKKATKKKTK